MRPDPDAETAPEDRYRARLEQFEHAASEFARLANGMADGARLAIERLGEGDGAGMLILETMQTGGVEQRRLFSSRLRELEQALQMLRGESFRILVDGGHLTITEAARRGGISVQMTRRLYRAAGGEP